MVIGLFLLLLLVYLLVIERAKGVRLPLPTTPAAWTELLVLLTHVFPTLALLTSREAPAVFPSLAGRAIVRTAREVRRREVMEATKSMRAGRIRRRSMLTIVPRLL
jgi:hypothetical protein